MISRNACVAMVLAVLLAVAGCGDGSSNTHGGVAIVNLDRVAVALGYDVQVRDQLEANSNTLKQNLQNIRANLQSQIDTKRVEYGGPDGTGPMSEAQRQEIASMKQQADQHMAQALQQAQQEQARVQGALVAQFRDKIKPVVDTIASEHGFTIVLLNNEAIVLRFRSQVDITDAVIAKMQAAAPPATIGGSAPTPPAQP